MERLNLVDHNGWLLILCKYYNKCKTVATVVETRTDFLLSKTGFLRAIKDEEGEVVSFDDVEQVYTRPVNTYYMDDKIIAKSVYPAREMTSIRDLPDGRLAFCEYYLSDELTTEMKTILGETDRMGFTKKKMVIDEIMLTKLSDWSHPTPDIS